MLSARKRLPGDAGTAKETNLHFHLSKPKNIYLDLTFHDPSGFRDLHWTCYHCSAFTTVFAQSTKKRINAAISVVLFAAFMIFVFPSQSIKWQRRAQNFCVVKVQGLSWS